MLALFSATLPERAEELARSIAAAPVRITVGERNAAAASVRQRLVFVGSEAGKVVALRDLLRSPGGDARPPYLVFANSKQRAAQLQRCACSTESAEEVLHVPYDLDPQTCQWFRSTCPGCPGFNVLSRT